MTIQPLIIPDSLLQKIANQRLGHEGLSLSKIILRQAIYEAWVRLLKGINFRRRNNHEAVQAYQKMSVDEFEGINLRQQWSNWHTIPRNLNGRVPEHPLYALDLCCGVGHSTEVLACYLPTDSVILGLEYNFNFVARARGRVYLDKSKNSVKVRFNTQSVLETFREESGVPIETGVVDLVNCSGAVGCHFDAQGSSRLAHEIARVLRPGAIAMIDSGRNGTSSEELTRIFKDSNLTRIHATRSCFADPYLQIVFQKK